MINKLPVKVRSWSQTLARSWDQTMYSNAAIG